MRAFTTRLSTKGQIVLPAALREQLGLREGCELLLTVAEGKIEIELAVEARSRRRKAALREADEIAHALASEWQSDLDAVAAVQEQRR